MFWLSLSVGIIIAFLSNFIIPFLPKLYVGGFTIPIISLTEFILPGLLGGFVAAILSRTKPILSALLVGILYFVISYSINVIKCIDYCGLIVAYRLLGGLFTILGAILVGLLIKFLWPSKKMPIDKLTR